MGARKSPSEVKVESRLSRVTELSPGSFGVALRGESDEARQIHISSIDHGVLPLYARPMQRRVLVSNQEASWSSY
jgi:hypothetical protein